MNSHFLQELEAACSEQNSLAGSISDMSSGTNIASESSGSGLKTESSTMHLSTAISEHSLVQDVRSFTKGLRMSLPEDSPVNPSQSQENKKGQTMKETCGQQQQTLFGLSGLDQSCSKMCREYANTCPWSSETCGDLGMTFGDPSSLELTTLEPRTGGSESGLWPTPDSSPRGSRSEAGMNKGHTINLQDAVKFNVKTNGRMWPTPTSSMVTEADFIQAKFHSSKRPTYQEAKNVPTPTAQDAKNNGGASQHHRNAKTLNAEVGGSLNPEWVEYFLMGWPRNWSSLEPLTQADFQEWMDMQGDEWMDEPDIPRVAKGVKDRVSRLKAIGNGQVSQCAAMAWKILNSMETV